MATAELAKVETYLRSLISTFAGAKEEASEALQLISERVTAPRESLAFRLLALRRYLRLGEERVVAQWAWTAEQTREMMGTGRAKVMYSLATRTQQIFAQNNSGHTLQISPLRSLDRQVELWVGNVSARDAGERLLNDIQTVLGGDEFPMTPNMTSISRFRVKLKSARVIPEPTSAAPGTSDHGQGNAVDFVVVRGKQEVAGTKSSHIRTRWKADGWEARLIAAVKQCNEEQLKNPVRPAPQLSGPLQKPYEPWHWVLSYDQPNA
jgi:hypothetical protein